MVRLSQKVKEAVDGFIAALEKTLCTGQLPGVTFHIVNEPPVCARLSAWGAMFEISFAFAISSELPRGVLKVGTCSTHHVPTVPLFHWFIDEQGSVLATFANTATKYSLQDAKTIGRFLDQLAGAYLEMQARGT